MNEILNCIRVEKTPHNYEIKICYVTWDGPHTRETDWRVIEKLKLNTLDEEINYAIKEVIKNPKYFRECTECNQINMVGDMYDNTLCHGCASDKLKIVY